MNPLQRLLFRLGLDAPLQIQADELATQCAGAVSASLNGTFSSQHEARGYIRARAALPIQRRVAELQGLTETCRRQLCEMVADRLSQRLTPQMLQQSAVQRRAA